MDQFESFLSYKPLRLILELPEPNSRPGRTTYDSFPSEEEVFEGIKQLGYVGQLNNVTDFDKSNLPPVWYALFSVIIRCLTSKHSGIDSASLINLAIHCRLSWPQVPDYEMTYIQKEKRSFNYSMTILYALIANYADVTDEDVIEYCMENELWKLYKMSLLMTIKLLKKMLKLKQLFLNKSLKLKKRLKMSKKLRYLLMSVL
ncbi:hypothetical protein L6452_19100 [Arctium lappa]|uniref:Uncharacterized protein n=1 Tax=Arctium lappa TaxID=4217 RepID=A0ACB9B8I1_ARCLA|nr:hypothetical protein L6452_19100 [Arctium lappa]